ncbi:hypothetical protein PV342_40560 [Streptomyces sp. PA03-3a]|nr:hypothetical protein [Streptomyces sp. PA03-3a]
MDAQPNDHAIAIVRDCYTTGQPQRMAVELTGCSPSWVAAQYRRLKASGISRMPGQMELFDPSPATP